MNKTKKSGCPPSVPSSPSPGHPSCVLVRSPCVRPIVVIFVVTWCRHGVCRGGRVLTRHCVVVSAVCFVMWRLGGMWAVLLFHVVVVF